MDLVVVDESSSLYCSKLNWCLLDDRLPAKLELLRRFERVKVDSLASGATRCRDL
jgi:hypothetical protein